MAASAYFDAVQKLYIAYYGRPADQQGRDFWAGKIDAAKGDIQAVVNAFGTSAEAQSIYGSVSVAAQVNNLFKNILGRDADIAGLNFYVGKINSGEYSLASLAQRILDGASTGDDAKVVANKLAAANAFTAAIDTTAEVLAYSGTTAAQQARDYLVKVTADATTVPTADAAQTAVTGLSTSTGGTSTQSFALTAGVDTLVGTSGNDVFTARLADNGNTLNSGDQINGGAGADVLNATLGNASKFAIAAETTGVETVSIRSQATNTGGTTSDNNIESAQRNTVDAQDMVGVTNWINSNSRADLVIEDVRILDKQITKDVTITMRDTDPGNVDYGVYFDQLSLRNVTSATSQINLRVMDTYAASKGEAVLKDSPYGSFTYYASEAGGEFKKVTLASDGIQKAQTFAEMVTALQAAADATLGKGVVTVALGTQYIVPDSVTGTQVTGTEIILKSNTDTVFDTTRAGSGWLATDTVPAVSGLYTSFNTAATKSTDLVTSTIVLDNVGRGSNGGDLIVGGMSVGTTSTSKGVQRFEITVEDDSKLAHIASTNNSLQEVTIKNGTTDRAQNAYNEYVKNAGLLEVNGRNNGNANNLLPDAAEHQNSAYGFDDVRLIDASAMTGKLSFTAQFSEKAVAKYLNLKDVLAPAGDNINVVYTGGSAADSIKVDIDQKAVASNSNINVGREDFSFAFNGGAGDDVLDIALSRDLTLLGGNEVWYTNHRINDNVTINAGDGNDTVKTPGVGDFNINLGAGNDTAYTDNTGVVNYNIKDKVGNVQNVASNAVWVFNTADQAGLVNDPDSAERNLGDLLSAARATVGSYGVKLAVNFRGLTKTVELSDKDYQLSDLEVNQAIKDAINGDVVLNKLLKAEDGPSGTLIVTSLTDGVRVDNDLTVAAILPDVTSLNATVLAAYNAANKTTIADTATLLTTITNNVNGWFTLKSTAEGADTALSNVNAERFNSALAVDNGQVAIVGANGTAASDNKISGDAGNDVIVLSTTGNNVANATFGDAASNVTGANSQLGFSNETIKFAAGFGNDVIVNFKADTDTDANEFSAGYDILDFTALKGDLSTQVDLTTLVSTDKSINVIARVDGGVVGTAEVGDNFSAAALKLTLDANATVDGTVAGTESNHVFIVYDTNNVASVYTVVDGVADNDLVVTLQGTIDLADTQWSTLTVGNFV